MSGSSRGGFSVVISAQDNATKTIEGINHSLEKMKAPAVALEKSFSKLAETTGIVALKEGMEHVAESSNRAFENLGRMVAPLEIITGAASIAGLSRLVTGFATAGTELYRAGQRSRISAGDLAAFEGAATLAGSSAGAMGAGVKELNDNMFHAAQGTAPDAIMAFEKLGVSWKNADGSLRNVRDVLPEVIGRLSDIQDPTFRAQLATKLFGGAVDGLGPVLRLTRQQFEAYVTAARAHGTMTDEQAKKALELDEAQRRLEVSATGLANTISTGLAHVIAPLLDEMTKWIDANREVIGQDVAQWAQNVATWVKTAAPEVKEFATQANAVAQQLGGWKTIIEAIVAIKFGGWIASSLAAFAPLLRVLLMIPGSGVTSAGLTAAGLGYLAFKGAEATGTGVAEAAERGMIATGFDEFGNPLGYRQATPGELGQMGGARFGAESQRKMPPASGTEKAATAKLVHDQFRAAGYTEEQTAGVLANVNAESGFDANAIDPSGISKGLFQHTGPRRVALEAKYGPHPTALQETQFAIDEFGPGGSREAAGIHLRAAKNSAQAGATVSNEFEAPADPGEAMRRGHAAANYVGLYNENSANMPPVYSPVGGPVANVSTPPAQAPAMDVGVAQAPAANIGGGSGTTPGPAQTTTVKGSADLRVRISADPGLTAKTTATTSGDLFSGAPNIGPAMGVP